MLGLLRRMEVLRLLLLAGGQEGVVHFDERDSVVAVGGAQMLWEEVGGIDGFRGIFGLGGQWRWS